MLDYIHACLPAATDDGDDLESGSILNMQTKCRVPDRIPIRLQVTMRAILPILCSLLRSWTVLPSGL